MVPALRFRLPTVSLLLTLAIGCSRGSHPTAPTVAPVTPVAKVAERPLPKFPDGWPYRAGAGAVSDAKGMVVSDAALASRVGADVLRSGGNAIDAAVATAFALAVVHPTAGNVAGGGFIVASMNGSMHALDFREAAPAAASHDMYIDPAAGGKATSGSREGAISAGVPGSVAGLFEAHGTLGSKTKTWAELVAPAIRLAEEGFVVDAALAKSVGESSRLKKYPASAALFFPGGEPLAVGATWKNTEFAQVLRRIADKGPPGFYDGPTADLIVAEMKRGGGIITKADLQSYRAKWRTPIGFEYRGYHVTSMPPPSSGGVTVAMICHILEGYDVGKEGWHTPVSLHHLFEAMRRAYAARNEVLGDPDFVKNPIEKLMSTAWATKARATIKDDKATPSAEVSPQGAPSGGNGPHTTHFSVVDGKGNAVGLTTTLNLGYGSGVTVTGGGFLLNNEMDDFSARPGSPNAFGLIQGEANAIAPNKRMLSSMAPTIVTAPDGHIVLVLGASGGPTIINAVFEILSNVVDYGFDVATAVKAPRFHQQDWPDVVINEKDGLPEDLRKALTAMGHAFKERGHIADAPAVGWDGVGAWLGAADPRAGGGLAAGP